MTINPMQMNINPISNYNQVLNNTFSEIGKFSQNNSVSEFENILDKQLKGAVEINDTDVQQNDKIAKSSVEAMLNQFSDATTNGLNSVNTNIKAAEKAAETFASGGDISVHDVMIAAEKSSLSLNLAIQMRNRLLSAYNEINNVRV